MGYSYHGLLSSSPRSQYKAMIKKLQKPIDVILLFFMVVGCGGRAAAPVMVHQYGAMRKNLVGLLKEKSHSLKAKIQASVLCRVQMIAVDDTNFH